VLEEQGLARDDRHGGRFERLGDQDGRFGPVAGQESLREAVMKIAGTSKERSISSTASRPELPSASWTDKLERR
jgi:hypothetical protein